VSCRFDAKCKRIQAESPHGRRPAWAVRPVIVKSGDDCRQELLAVQLISTFYDIFQVLLSCPPVSSLPWIWVWRLTSDICLFAQTSLLCSLCRVLVTEQWLSYRLGRNGPCRDYQLLCCVCQSGTIILELSIGLIVLLSVFPGGAAISAVRYLLSLLENKFLLMCT